MNVLEKILEEKEMEAIKELIEENEKCCNQCEGACSSIKNGICNCGDGVLVQAIQKMQDLLESKKNESDDWIPCSERLPEEHDSAFAIYKDTHLWSKSMFEKVSEPVNITYELEDGIRKTGTSHTLDGKWKIEKENRIVKVKVIAWKPLPEAYKAADSKPDWKENMLNTFLAGH